VKGVTSAVPHPVQGVRIMLSSTPVDSGQLSRCIRDHDARHDDHDGTMNTMDSLSSS
jgi:hypothetical protein